MPHDEINNFVATVPEGYENATLDEMARAALSTESKIITTCPQIAPDLVARWISGASSAAEGVTVLEALARDVATCAGIERLCEHFVSKMGFMEMLRAPLNDVEQANTILLALYRLVSFDRETYRGHVDQEVVSQLLAREDTRFYAAELLYKTFEMTKCDHELEYLEAERVLAGQKESVELADYTVFVASLNSLNVLIGSSLVPRLGGPSGVESDYVKTDTSAAIMNELGHALTTQSPVLLIGPSGSGKTFYVNEVAGTLSKLDSMVRIHLGDQTDSKLLIGAYTTGEKPGSFEWRDGVLTTAVKEGRWVLVEDIDRAPTDVVSVLLSLLEKRELVIPSRGETIRAHGGFRLLGTMRNSNGHIPDIIGLRLWNQIPLKELESTEIVTIIRDRFPVVAPMAQQFEDTFSAIRELYSQSSFVSLTKSAVSRHVSLSDLVKLCKRVSAMITRLGYSSPNDPLPAHVFDYIFLEALDCFAGFLSSDEARTRAAQVIGESLEMSAPRIDVIMRREPQYESTSETLQVGRAQLTKAKPLGPQKKEKSSFATTVHAAKLMEQISVAISSAEPTLLVGETGTGKTTVVQNVASLMNKKLTVVNVSQQTEAGDLLGGFKPVDVKMIAVPMMDEFSEVFSATFSAKKNVQFMQLLTKAFNGGHWKNCARLWREAVKMSVGKLASDDEGGDGGKRRKLNLVEARSLRARWAAFASSIDAFEVQFKQIQSSFVFQFVEGAIVQAVRKGEWVLLDEINLAAPDTLEAISDLLSEPRTLLLSEKGDAETITAHPDFRLFACMNPATDVGKRDLPLGLRSRFTELYVFSPDRDFDDLLKIIDRYIGHLCLTDATVGIHNDVANLYLTAKRLSAENKIVDGAGQKPHFSIRTLSRTLVYVSQIAHLFGPRGLRRSLYEGFCMSFLTLLDLDSEAVLHEVIKQYTLNKMKDVKAVMGQKPKAPSDKHVAFEHYWLEPGPLPPFEDPKYVMTPFVLKNLLNLVRATSGKASVLIQGPTSAGKTSMIQYLAKKTGHEFVRINNHEHTDLQEYLGTYVADNDGKLKFKEGVLVQALRRGAWIVLDELNLAPTDVLEALNRLLDDNRELLIPETQEVVRPHPQFRLFATQNPPGLYGGRKQLSRAFRNRFLELHFGDIPEGELEQILFQRAQIPPSYAKKIVDVYRELSAQRQASRVFEQNSFATLRDLFRWAGRLAQGYENLAMDGFLLLGERVRNPAERLVVKKAIEKIMKVKIDESALYDQVEVPVGESGVVMTNGLRRLVHLVQSAALHKEPVLLVGETGCGKTTVCQLLAAACGKNLHIVNAHQNMETGDIIGSFRPVRNRSDLQMVFRTALLAALKLEDEPAASELSNDDLDKQYIEQLKRDPKVFSDEEKTAVAASRNAQKVLFQWSDGSLIQALKTGDFFLLDEISLADDSVLERLNSVLEPERTLLLAEKGSDASEASVTAQDDFQFSATMNPGGDYGKKELSLALRNRFTEIWVPSMEDFGDVRTIVESRLGESRKSLASAITTFSEWFAIKYGGSATSGVISLRDLLAWVQFINKFEGDSSVALLHGALMVFIDALGTGLTAYLGSSLGKEKRACVAKLEELSGLDLMSVFAETPAIEDSPSAFQVGHFALAKTHGAANPVSFNLNAPTTCSNAMKVARGLQVPKPILLEGSPGVGKTSLITSIASVLGKPLTRINLSEQTDLIDLFGSDSPAEDSEAGNFVWRDAPFLRAMQAGEWVLLDEMNLASQSVLEGLNACLDHRGQTYIPELDKFFTCAPGFTVFAAQNPQHQGGGRKGLPKSFVNRFTVVYVDALDQTDLFQIAQHLYPEIEHSMSDKMIRFIAELDKSVQSGKWGLRGSPWEFNMRDTMRWMSLVRSGNLQPADYLRIIAGDRFRTAEDREQLEQLYVSIFGECSDSREYVATVSDNAVVQCGKSVLAKNQLTRPAYGKNLSFLHCNSQVSETLISAINAAWPIILVGPSSSGKTSLIRLMAQQAGAVLDEIALNADVDSVDLVGGYEQVDLSQKRQEVEVEVRQVFGEWAIRELSRGNLDGLAKAMAHKADTSMDADLQARISALYSRLESLAASGSGTSSVRFQWIDGILVNAVSQGHWLVLDNANLCSASVLDRLNSLLEPNGTLILNESALADGSPRVITPHANFRIFLTVNPRYGELSRAMRNRAVEIFLPELQERMSEYDRVRLLVTASGAPIASSGLLTLRQSVSELAELPEVASKDIAAVALRYLSWNMANADFAGVVGKSAAPPHAKETVALVQQLCREFDSAKYQSLLQSLVPKEQTLPVLNAFLDCSLDPDVARLTQLGTVAPMLTVLLRVVHTGRSLDAAAQTAVSQKTSLLTYLEKSAATVSGRRMKDAAPGGLYLLLSRALDAARVCDYPADRLLRLLDIVDQVVVNTSTTGTVESQFHVYAAWLEEWVRESGESGSVESVAFAAAVKSFDAQIKLERGVFMRQVWEHLCPKVPSTGDGWAAYEQVVQLCDKFDGICAKMPASALQTVVMVKGQFAGLLAEASQPHAAIAPEFFAALQDAVDAIVFETNDDKPYVALFGALATVFELAGLPTTELNFYACRSAKPQPILELLTAGGNGFAETSADHLASKFIGIQQQFSHTKNGAVQHNRADFANLGRLLSDQNNVILANKKPALAQLVVSTLSDLEEVGSSISDPASAQTFETAVSSLSGLADLLSNPSVLSLGQCYVSVFKTALDLYVPNVPYDPAIKEYVDFDMQERLEALAKVQHAVDGKFKAVFFGVPETEYEPSSMLFSPRVFRDSSVSIDLMIREWNQFMLVVDGLFDKLQRAEQVQESSASFVAELQLFQDNTQQFVARLKHSYPRYADLCDILDTFVCGFRLGVFMIQQHLQPPQERLWTANSLTLASTEALSCTLDDLVEFCRDRSAEDLTVEKTLAFVLEVVGFQQRDGALDELVAFCCHTMYARWTLRRLRMEEQAAIEASGFTSNLDETAEEEFSKLFPDYDIKLDDAGNVIKPKVTKADVDYSPFLQAYECVFGGRKVSTSNMLLRGLSLVPGAGLVDHVMPSLLQGHVSVLHNDTIEVAETAVAGVFDFYRQHSAAETKKVVVEATKLKKFMASLLEKWPEHATLQNIHFQCEELLNFSVVTPVARLLAKVEQIYTFLHEWEKLASRDVSVRVYIDSLTELIISWRRLELAMWPKLFDFEEQAQKEGMGIWWFNVYETLVVNPSGEATEFDVAELVQTLNLFLSQGTLGQFVYRLDLLRAVEAHVKTLPSTEKIEHVLTALASFLEYYALFVPAIEAHIAARKTKLQKDIQEIILLASWKDTNVHALKDSARKSHRKLFKVVKKYRDVLCETVKPVLEGGMKIEDRDVVAGTVCVPVAADLTSALELYTPTFVQDAPKTLGILHKRISVVEQIDPVKLMDIVGDVLSEAARLKKVTPNHLTEDNKKEIGALRVEKQRFLAETLKELRMHGFKGKITNEVLQSQASLSSVLGCISTVDGSLGVYFMRLIDTFSKLRAACANPAADVPHYDVSVASAMSENILRMCIRQNNALGMVQRVSRELSEVSGQLKSVSFNVSSELVSPDAVLVFLKGLLNVLDVLKQSSLNCAALSKTISSAAAKLTTVADVFIDRFTALRESFLGLKHLLDWKKPTAELQQVLADVNGCVEDLMAKLDDVSASSKSLDFVVELVSSYIKLVHTQASVVESADGSFEQVEKLCKSVLVVVQGILKKVGEAAASQNKSDNDDSDDDDDFTPYSADYNLLMGLTGLLHSETILAQTRDTIASVGHTPEGSASLSILRAFLDQYLYLCGLVSAQVETQFADLTKGGYLLSKSLYNLAVNGFCSPEEEQEPDNDDNATATGTGLGDGSGAQDHSGDVGEDENLDDYMEQENEDQEDEERDPDEEDNAVDVEGDMAGKNEHASDQDDDEDDESKEKEDEDELDEEAGNLDDLDPNAMDDKMWNDDEDDKDDKEKKGDVDDANDDKSGDAEEADMDEGDAGEGGQEDEEETKDGEEKEGDDGEGEEEKEEEDSSAEDEDDVGLQDDDVKQKDDKEGLDDHVDDTEVLELPEDMNLDGEGDDKDDGEDDEFDDGLDGDEEEEDQQDGEGDDEEMNDVDGLGDEDGEEDKDDDENIDEDEGGNGEVNDDEVEDADEMDEGADEDNTKEDAEQDAQDDLPQDGQHNEDGEDLDVDMDGLHGQDDQGAQEDDNDEAAVKQDSGEKGSGNDVDSKDEENDVGGSGQTQSNKEDDDDEAKEDQDAEDEGEKAAVDSLKQLGDALKEFHKKKEEIRNASTDEPEDDSAGANPQEFEHTDGPDSKHDTQAMGSADRDIKQDIDDDMALEDEDEDQRGERKVEKPEQAEIKEEEDDDDKMEEEGNPDTDNKEGAASAKAAEDAEDDEDVDNKVKAEMDQMYDDDDKVDDELKELTIKAEDEETALLSLSDSRDAWKNYQASTADLATTLCEQLRLILEPTLATKMRGDFKTGKRLNMKRIIPYIASSFKKDKIWMRRTKPSKRQYQIMISVDDSKSMNESPQCVDLAFQSISLISKALTQLESGQLAVMKFGETAELVHPFEKTFSDESGGDLVHNFSFNQDKTNVQRLVSKSIDIFQQQKLGGAELWQLQIIISDGICEDHDKLKQLVRHAREQKIMLVFVVIDALSAGSASGSTGGSSITEMKQAKYTSVGDQMVLKMEKYLDTFPFEFYVIVRDIKELPSVLSSVLRQFFAEVADLY